MAKVVILIIVLMFFVAIIYPHYLLYLLKFGEFFLEKVKTMKEKILWNHPSNNKTKFKEALSFMFIFSMIFGGGGILIILIAKLAPIIGRFFVRLFKYVANFFEYLNTINPNLGGVVFLFIAGAFIGLYLWWKDNSAEDNENV